ncbi:hypothetical protein [Mycoplasma sp. SG1]|uniref:hypothetical protein n=1 Tax=Mycoplasma sp. SG1 TaxID=2810348 RepID=UPI002024E9FE|nr:hypothetical protein [Mycoplasma sp. SG1]URM52934.1 hypothetical protein JRW51_01135 [Mycoplasma sp. SG1]
MKLNKSKIFKLPFLSLLTLPLFLFAGCNNFSSANLDPKSTITKLTDAVNIYINDNFHDTITQLIAQLEDQNSKNSKFYSPLILETLIKHKDDKNESNLFSVYITYISGYAIDSDGDYVYAGTLNIIDGTVKSNPYTLNSSLFCGLFLIKILNYKKVIFLQINLINYL